MFDVDLVDDSGPRGNHLEVVEGVLAPAQELVALPVSLVLNFDVALESVLVPEQISNDRVVDDQFGR